MLYNINFLFSITNGSNIRTWEACITCKKIFYFCIPLLGDFFHDAGSETTDMSEPVIVLFLVMIIFKPIQLHLFVQNWYDMNNFSLVLVMFINIML